jgi:hypothetical protein
VQACQSMGHSAGHEVVSFGAGQQLTRGGSYLQLTETRDIYSCSACAYNISKSRGTSSEPWPRPRYI